MQALTRQRQVKATSSKSMVSSICKSPVRKKNLDKSNPERCKMIQNEAGEEKGGQVTGPKPKARPLKGLKQEMTE